MTFLTRFLKNLASKSRPKRTFFRRLACVSTRRQRKTSTLKKHRKTSAGAIKFKVRAFAKSLQSMQKTSKNRCESVCKRRSFAKTREITKTSPKPLPKSPLKVYSRRLFFDISLKALPRWPKTRPRRVQEAPRTSQDGSKAIQKPSKLAHDAPKTRQDAPKTGPRRAQDTPRRAKMATESQNRDFL